MSTTACTVTARRPFTCQGYRCSNLIIPGEDYARWVAFPGDDVNPTDYVRVERICEKCQTKGGRNPMPPRRSRRKR